MRDIWLSPHLALVAVSPRICQVEPDWPESVRACGFLDTPSLAIEGTLPRECGFASGQRILYVGAVPHRAIFPRCRAEVHHGGAGTTQTATLAGKPSVVIAHLNEQEHWAGELRRLGVAGTMAKRRSVTAAGLARRIRIVLASPAMVAKAAALGAAMRGEDGVAEAVRLVMGRFGRGAARRGARSAARGAGRGGGAEPGTCVGFRGFFERKTMKLSHI